VIDEYELWTVKKDGSGAKNVAVGDFEDLVVAAGATSTGSSSPGTTTTTTTPTTTTTTPTTTAKKPAVTTSTKAHAGVATAIAVKVKGSRYLVTWKGTAKSWTVVLKVGTRTAKAKTKGSVHSHAFVLHGAHGKASARVKSP
jgi:hypothetical protein